MAFARRYGPPHASAALLLTLALCCCCTLASSAPSTGVPVDVFVGGTGGYACYRIPALLLLPDGGLLAFAEARKYNCGDHGFVDLVTRLSIDGGATWGPLSVVYSESSARANVTIGNPAPVLAADGSLLLPFCRNNTALGLLRSLDGRGASWTGPTWITTPVDWTWVASGPPGSLLLSSGRIVLPIDFAGGGSISSAVFTSDDGGNAWALTLPAVEGGNECQAAWAPWLSPPALMLSMRASSGPARLVAFSHDSGSSWGPPVRTNVVETACEASTVALPDAPGGPVFAMSSAYSAKRTNMTVLTSVDGVSWSARVNVYPGSAAYSSLVARGGEGLLGLLFERDAYAAIAYVNVTL